MKREKAIFWLQRWGDFKRSELLGSKPHQFGVTDVLSIIMALHDEQDTLEAELLDRACFDEG